MAKKIWCFSTPTRDVAEKHPKDHFGWMLNGAELFAKLVEAGYLLFDDHLRQTPPQVCFETFPHAIACTLAGKIVSAKHKRAIRRALLNRANIDTSKLTNIDQIDAALCALAAHHFSLGNFKPYGDAKDGFIVVPGRPLTSSPETAETGGKSLPMS
jgi:predicted nuclease with RNAse H fold